MTTLIRGGLETPYPAAKGRGMHQYRLKNAKRIISDPKDALFLNVASGK